MKKIIVTVIGSLLVTTIHAQPNLNLAVGDGMPSSDPSKLLLFAQTDNAPWKQLSFSNNLPGSAQIQMHDAHCKDQNCVAVGQYYTDDDDGAKPIVIVSDTYGLNLTMIENFIGMPQDIESIEPYSALCTSTSCHVFGGYRRKNDEWFHAFALSADKDNLYNWKVQNIANMPENLIESSIFSNTCSGNMCIAIGWSLPEDKIFKPFLLLSDDAGQSWSYSAINYVNRKEDFGNSFLSSMTCHNNLCIAVGAYEKQSKKVEEALILVSKDSGKNWSFSQVNAPNLGKTDLTKVVMNDDQMVAIGYTKNNGKDRNLLLTSYDQGLTWQTNPLPKRTDLLRDVTCIRDQCIVVGDIQTEGSDETLILVSTKGQPWKRVNKIANKPANIFFDVPFAVNCHKNLCNIVGEYDQMRTKGTKPMVLSSDNGGLAWTFEALDQTAEGSLRFLAGN